jgi:L-rhamnose isomerase
VVISLHCWQGDDVGGFEDPDRGLSGGIMATGNYPGKARNGRRAAPGPRQAYSLIPGRTASTCTPSTLETDGQVPRNEIEPEHFAGWLDWAKENNHGLDFQPDLLLPPLADDGFTLATPTPASAASGSSTASPAAGSAPISAASWARPA